MYIFTFNIDGAFVLIISYYLVTYVFFSSSKNDDVTMSNGNSYGYILLSVKGTY